MSFEIAEIITMTLRPSFMANILANNPQLRAEVRLGAIFYPGNECISHLGKRKIIDSKVPFGNDMLVSWRVEVSTFFVVGD